MGTNNLEFQFLDLSEVSNEETNLVKVVLDCLQPGSLVPAVELPWSVTNNLPISEKICKDASGVSEPQALPAYPPPDAPVIQSTGQSSLEQLSVSTATAVSETPQFSANAPAFIPASVATVPTNMGVPPFTGMPQNMQQFPPQFLSRPPFSMSGTYNVPMDSLPSPSGLPVTAMEIVSHHPPPHDSPTNRHHYHPVNNTGHMDLNHEENLDNRHKQQRHYTERHHNSRHKTTLKKKPHSHLDHNALEMGNSAINVNIIDPYRMGHMMTSEESLCINMNTVVTASELISPDHMAPAVSNNGPPPNMLPLPPHHAHASPFPIPMAPSSYQMTYSQPPQPHFYFYPMTYMPQTGPNSPVVGGLQPLVDSDNMVVGNVTGPPPGMTGLYEGSPLTMAHSVPMHQTQTHLHHNQHQHNHQQHGQHQNLMMGSKETLVHSQECYPSSSNQEACFNASSRTITAEIMDKDFVEIAPDSAGESVTYAAELENTYVTGDESKVSDERLNDSENIGLNISEEKQDSETVPSSNDEIGSETRCVAAALEPVIAKNRTITPEPTGPNSLEDSGVDVGADSPPLPVPQKSAETGKRWSDLFKNNSSSSGVSDSFLKTQSSNLPNATHNGHSNDDSFCFANDYEIQKIGRLLQSYQPDFTPQPFQPRGLINKSNWCYINATLQALLVCAPFHNLVKTLQLQTVRPACKSKIPIMSSLVKLITEFDNATSGKKKKKDDLNIGHPFEPSCMHAMLTQIKSECIKGRQEDAEEFLSCILNGLHDEMVSMIKTVSTPDAEIKGCNGQSSETNGHLETTSEDDVEDQDWRMMGKKGKGSGTITRTSANLSQSPVKAIFGGVTRSLLTSGSESSATLQPFFTLQLDIQADGVNSVEDALGHLIAKESIQGYTCSKTKKEVEASRRMTLEELPPVLILHFKRFVYDDKDGGSKKVLKKMDYPLDLELKKELLSQEVRSRFCAKYHRNYRLFAVVYHDGKEAVKGHYVADIYHAGSNGWLHCDDRNIKAITESEVLTYNSPCVPYLLFYGREAAQSQIGAK